MPKPKVTTVPLSHIRTHYNAKRTQLREQLDDATVESYAEDIQAGATFPPIQLVPWGKRGFLIADGWHRYTAHQMAEKKKIKAEILEPFPDHTPLQSAIRYALEANRAHGLRLTTGDKGKKARAALLIPSVEPLSDRQISRLIGISHQTVSRARNDLARQQLIPHPATREPVCDCTPSDYVGIQIIKETFEDVDRFRQVLRFVRQLIAVAPAAWTYDLENDQVTHRGLEGDKAYQFPVYGNEIVGGKPKICWEARAVVDDWDSLGDSEADNTGPITDQDRDRGEAEAAKKAFDAAASRIKATGKADLIGAVETLQRYRNTPDLFADLRLLIINGGPADEHGYNDF